MSAHVERQVGRIGWVLHELKSEAVHVDLLWVPPGPRRDFHTFVTCGMAERPMRAPVGWQDCRHAELVLRLPPTWKLGPRDLGDPRCAWPLKELEHLARMPHVHSTWLWARHTVANGYPPAPLRGAPGFCGSILVPLVGAGRNLGPLRVNPRRCVHFFGVIPLFPRELDLAREAGPAALLERLERAGVTDLLDVGRASVAGGALRAGVRPTRSGRSDPPPDRRSGVS